MVILIGRAAAATGHLSAGRPCRPLLSAASHIQLEVPPHWGMLGRNVKGTNMPNLANSPEGTDPVSSARKAYAMTNNLTPMAVEEPNVEACL